MVDFAPTLLLAKLRVCLVDTVVQACPTFFGVVATLVKFGLHAGNIKCSA